MGMSLLVPGVHWNPRHVVAVDGARVGGEVKTVGVATTVGASVVDVVGASDATDGAAVTALVRL